MSQQLICDDCGEPIDVTKPYYTLTGTKIQMTDGLQSVLEASVTLDYHEEHLPNYKVQGQPVIPPETPETG